MNSSDARVQRARHQFGFDIKSEELENPTVEVSQII